MTNIYISNARKAAQLSFQGRRESLGLGFSKTRLGICSVYKWQGITLFVVRPAAHMCLCGESPLSARTGEGLATRQVGEGNDLDGGSR